MRARRGENAAACELRMGRVVCESRLLSQSWVRWIALKTSGCQEKARLLAVTCDASAFRDPTRQGCSSVTFAFRCIPVLVQIVLVLRSIHVLLAHGLSSNNQATLNLPWLSTHLSASSKPCLTWAA